MMDGWMDKQTSLNMIYKINSTGAHPSQFHVGEQKEMTMPLLFFIHWEQLSCKASYELQSKC